MTWYKLVTQNIIENHPVEDVNPQQIIDLIEQLKAKVDTLYQQDDNFEGAIKKHQLVWKLLFKLNDDYDDLNSIKKALLDVIYINLHEDHDDIEAWRQIYQQFGIALDEGHLDDDVDLAGNLDSIANLFAIDLYEDGNREIERNYYAQRMAILFEKNHLSSNPAYLSDVTVGRSEALYAILRNMDSYILPEQTKKYLFKIFESFCQMDLIAIAESWDTLKDKLLIGDNGGKFNAFYAALFEHRQSNTIIKYLLNNNVIADIDWLYDNRNFLEEDDPVKAMNIALAITDDHGFNEKLNELINIANEKNVKIYVGQLKHFYPNYLDAFNALYEKITDDDEEVQSKGLRSLSYYQCAVFLIQNNTYYQKCKNFFSQIDLTNYFDSDQVNIEAIDVTHFFDSKEIGADEKLRIHELITQRLFNEIDCEQFNLVKFCHFNFQPAPPNQSEEFSLTDFQHLSKIDVLLQEVKANDISEIDWNQQNLTFCYKYLLQHMAGLKTYDAWDDLNLDNLMGQIAAIDNNQDKVKIMAMLSGFHVYLLNQNAEVTQQMLANALTGLLRFVQQPYQDIQALQQINQNCPAFLQYFKNNRFFAYIAHKPTQLFTSSIQIAIQFANIPQPHQNRAQILLDNFDQFLLGSNENFRTIEIETAKQLICKIVTSIHSESTFNQKAFSSWLKQLDGLTPLNFQFAHQRALLVFEQRIEQLDNQQQAKFNKGVQLLIANTDPLQSTSAQEVETAYQVLYDAIHTPNTYIEFQNQQDDTAFIIKLAQSYSSKTQLPQQENQARLALKAIADAIFQVSQELDTNNPYQLRGTAGIKRTYYYQQGDNEVSRTLWITATMDTMMKIIDKARQGKITSRHAHAQIMTLGQQACIKHTINDDDVFNNNNGVELKKEFYLKIKQAGFKGDDVALVKTEQLCRDYCQRLKNEIEQTPWAIAFGVGKTVNGNRISKTMIKMREAMKDAEKGIISWEVAYHYIHKQAVLAIDRRSSPSLNINLFSKSKTDPAKLYEKIKGANLLCGADESTEQLLDKVGQEIQQILDNPKWGPSGMKKTLSALFGGETIHFGGNKYKHRPEHLAKAVANYNAYQAKHIDARTALDAIRAIFQQASTNKTWLRSAGMHTFYQQQAKTLSVDLEQAGVNHRL